jgi:methyltransferase (TIGR00027 family)
MKTRVSQTARYVALFRALETNRRPARERMFHDPLAEAFLTPGLRGAARLGALPVLGGGLRRFIDWRWPGARSAAVTRTRVIDELVTRAVERGMRQVVLLGAGYDTRAYRLASLRDCRVFEVDLCATQLDKRARLEKLLGALPEHVRFIPLDLSSEPLFAALERGGYRAGERAAFIWEGVTNYLTQEGVDATLRAIAGALPGSELSLTYVHRGLLDRSQDFGGTRALFRTLERSGEVWTFGIDPSEIEGYLGARGFELLADASVAEHRARYFGARRFRGYEFYRIAHARVCDQGKCGAEG